MAYIDSFGVEYTVDKLTLVQCTKDIGAFYTIPVGVKYIKIFAFIKCKSLKAITLPNTLIDASFIGCKQLTEVYFQGNLSDWLSKKWSPSFDSPYNLYLNGVLLTNIIIPEGITTIAESCFYFCKSINNVVFNNDIKIIGANAFSKSGLSGDITLPINLRGLGERAFFFCQNITSVTIPKDTQFIGAAAFAACKKLERITVHEQNTKYSSKDGILTNIESATIIAFPRLGFKYNFLLPKYIKNIEDDVFAFNNIPYSGISINHDLNIIHKRAFRETTHGDIHVPVGKGVDYLSKGINPKIIKEKFNFRTAFKDGHKKGQFEAIANNPFRILGVFSNATAREISLNTTKIRRYLEVGEKISFPTDLDNILTPVIRTEESIEKALSQINLPEDKLRHAVMWFSCVNEKDKEALDFLTEGNLEQAKALTSNPSSYFTLQFHAFICLLMGNMKDAQMYYDIFFHENASFLESGEFVNSIVGDKFPTDSNTLEHFFEDALLTDLKEVDLLAFYKNTVYVKNDFKSYIICKIKDYFVDCVKIEISKNQVNSDETPQKHYETAVKIKDSTKKYVDYFKLYLTDNDIQRQIVGNTVSMAIINNAIFYYNKENSDRDIVAYNTFDLMQYSLSIAEGKMEIDRCKDNIQVVKKVIDKLPFKDIYHQFKRVENNIKNAENKKSTIASAINLMKICEEDIRSIREFAYDENYSEDRWKISKDLEILSTNIVSLSLRMVINEVNQAIDTKSSLTKMTLNNAWQAFISMDEFDIESDFKSKRYIPNRKTLYKSTFGSLIGYREQYEKKHDPIDLRTEDEYWKYCQQNEIFPSYLYRYPHGRHAEQARNELNKFEEEIRYDELEKNFDNKKTVEENQSTDINKSQDALYNPKNDITNKIKKNKKSYAYISKEKTILKYIIGILVLLLIPTVAYTIGGQEYFENVIVTYIIITVFIGIGFLRNISNI